MYDKPNQNSYSTWRPNNMDNMAANRNAILDKKGLTKTDWKQLDENY